MLEQWINRQALPRGIGVDCVHAPALKALDERTRGAFRFGAFTVSELFEADAAPDRWAYLAGRFAAKEAVFKALCPLLPGSPFDFRRVETLQQKDGSPRITRAPWLLALLEKAGADDLLLSITHEDSYAIAFCQAVQTPKTRRE